MPVATNPAPNTQTALDKLVALAAGLVATPQAQTAVQIKLTGTVLQDLAQQIQSDMTAATQAATNAQQALAACQANQGGNANPNPNQNPAPNPQNPAPTSSSGVSTPAAVGIGGAGFVAGFIAGMLGGPSVQKKLLK